MLTFWKQIETKIKQKYLYRIVNVLKDGFSIKWLANFPPQWPITISILLQNALKTLYKMAFRSLQNGSFWRPKIMMSSTKNGKAFSNPLFTTEWHPPTPFFPTEWSRTSMKVLQDLQVLRLLRKTSLRCSKCCACHATRAGGGPSAATQNEAAPKVITCRRSADLYEGAPSAAPAMENEPEVLQVLRLPRKKRAGGAQSTAPAMQNAGLPRTSLKVLQVLACHNTNLRCSKCCTCHAKRGGAQSHGLPRTSVKVLQVLRLPRKTSLMSCS